MLRLSAIRTVIAIGMMVLSLSAVSFAAIATWDGGGGDNKWSTALNWSTDATPDASTNVVFRQISLKVATIDAAFGGTIASLTVEAGYTKTITASRDITVLGVFTMAGTSSATFLLGTNFMTVETFNQSGNPSIVNAGSGNLDINGDFTISNGTFTAPGATGRFTLAGNFNRSGGTFTHNSGVLTMDATASGKTIAGATFNNLTFSGDTGSWTFSNSPTINGNLIISGGIVYCAATNPSITGNFIINSGTFDAGTGSVSISGDYLNLSYLEPNTGTLIFGKGSGTQTCTTGGTAAGKAFKNLTHSGAGTLLFSVNDVKVNGNFANNVGTTNMNGLNLDVDGNFINGNYPLTAGPFISVGGNWSNGASATFTPGTGVVTFDGTGGVTQVCTTGGVTAGRTFNNITHSGESTLKILTNDIKITGNFINYAGTFDANSRAVNVTGSWANFGSFTFTTGIVTFDGSTTDKSITSGGSSFNHVTFNNATGLWTLMDDFDANGNFLLTNGYVDLSDKSVAIGGNFTRSAGTFNCGTSAVKFDATTTGKTITSGTSGTRSFNDVEFGGAGGYWTIQDNLDVNNDLVISAGTLDCSSKAISIGGDLLKTGTGSFGAGTGAVTFDTASKISNVTGNTAFRNFACVTPGKTISFEAGKTQTIEGTFIISGDVSGRVALESGSPGTKWKIDPKGTRSVYWGVVSDSENINASTIVTTKCAEGGSNIKWDIAEVRIVSAKSGASGGTIDPQGATYVTKGATQAYTITSAEGTRIGWIKVDGILIVEAAASPYVHTFTDVQVQHSIEAYFSSVSSKIWDGGGGDNKWSTAANWLGDVVPSSTDDIIFDGTSIKDVLIDNVSENAVNSLTIDNDYTGIITQDADLTVTSTYEQNSGKFFSNVSRTFSAGISFSLPLWYESDWDSPTGKTSGAFKRFGGGSGTSTSDAYLIYDIYGLQAMSGYLTSSFKLANDINAASTATWNGGKGFDPIGRGQTYYNTTLEVLCGDPGFLGALDGDGKTISNLYISRRNDFSPAKTGLFGALNNNGSGYPASITDLNLSGFSIAGSLDVGALAGNAGDDWHGLFTISGCTVNGTVEGRTYVGVAFGLVGKRAVISDCYSSGLASGETGVGGFAGGCIQYSYDGSVHDCGSSANVTASANGAGGFIGSLSRSNVYRCYATGNVSGYDYVGGLIGIDSSYEEEHSEVNDCYATGNVTGHNNVGGLAGYCKVDLNRCFSRSIVTGNNIVGGLVGNSTRLAYDCYFNGTVDAVSNYGDLGPGPNWSAAYRCYGIANINGSAPTTGKVYSGIFGYEEFPLSDLKKQATFTGWDFYDAWIIQENATYPYHETESYCWVGGLSGAWENSNNWRKNGVTGVGYPQTAADPAYIGLPAYSGGNITTSGDLTIGRLHVESYNGTITLGGNLTVEGTLAIDDGKLDVSGSNYNIDAKDLFRIWYVWASNNSATFEGRSGTVYFSKATGTQEIGTYTTAESQSFYNVVHSGNAKLRLSQSIRIKNNFTNQAGTFAPGSGKILYVGGDWINSAAVSGETNSTVAFYDSSKPSAIYGSNTFYNLACSTEGKNLTFEAGTTNIVNGTFIITGTAGNRVVLRSSSSESVWNIEPKGAISVTGVDVKDSTNLDATTINPAYALNSGNNTNWFSTCTMRATIGATSGLGTIDPYGTVETEQGASRVFTVTANPGNSIAQVKINNVQLTQALVSPFVYTFENCASDSTIEAVFIPSGTKVWDKGAGTSYWSDAANWSGNTLPASTDVVVFKSGGPYNASNTSSTVDAGFTGWNVLGISTESTFTSVITQESAITLEANLMLQGGSYIQKAPLRVKNIFRQTAGTFIQGAGVSVEGNFFRTAGTFTCTTPASSSLYVGNSFYTVQVLNSILFNRFTGAGTEGDPYLVYDVYGLQALYGISVKYVKLNNNINAEGTTKWLTAEGYPITGFAPITSFTGRIDGGGNSITGLYIKDPPATSNYVGLVDSFGGTLGVKDLYMTDVDINTSTGARYTGAVAGYNNTVLPVSNVHITGSVKANRSTGTYTGGFIGLHNTSTMTFQDCSFGGTVEGGSYVGGFIGGGTSNGGVNMYSSIVEADISAKSHMGGFIGNGQSGRLEGCYFSGTVSTNEYTGTNSYTGGLIGQFRSTIDVVNCTAEASVKGTGITGGLVGEYTGTLSNSKLVGTIQSSSGNLVGGIVGNCAGSTFTGLVVDYDVRGYGTYVGGIAGGSTTGNFTNCKVTGNISASGNFAGGIAGSNTSGTFTNCTVESYVKGATSTGGIAGSITTVNVSGCRFSGTAESTNSDSQVGGLIGTAAGGTVTGCRAEGSIIGAGNNAGGGIGYNSSAAISNCYFTGTVNGKSYTGGFLGNSGTASNVSNCSADADVVGTTSVGGFIGRHCGVITYSRFNGNVIGSGNDVGGFVGNGNGSNTLLSFCYSTGTVSGGGTATGGFSGTIQWGGGIQNCYSNSSVRGTSTYTGGFGGDFQNAVLMTDCYSTGQVNGTAYVGGFAAQTYSSDTLISRCYSTGQVIASGNYVGGFIGVNSSLVISNCYSTGGVNGADYVGGFVGRNWQKTEACYASNTVSGSGTKKGSFAGERVLGSPTGTFIKCYANSESNPGMSLVGTGGGSGEGSLEAKTAAQLKQKSMFINWDFDGTWTMDNGKCMPQLLIEQYYWTGSGDAVSWTDQGNWRLNLVKDSGYPSGSGQKAVLNKIENSISLGTMTLGSLHLGSSFVGNLYLTGDLVLDNSGTREGSLVLAGGVLNAGSNKITIDGNLRKAGMGVFTCGTGAVEFSGADPCTVAGSFTFNDLKCYAAGKFITFEVGTTHTIESSLILNGAQENRIRLRSSMNGFRWNIDPEGPRSVTGVDVKDSQNLSTEAVCRPNPSNFNSGNNINWFGRPRVSVDVIGILQYAGTIEPFGFTTDEGFNASMNISTNEGYYLGYIKIGDTMRQDMPLKIDYTNVQYDDSVTVCFMAKGTKLWRGAGNSGNWSDPANWTGNITPDATEAITFDSTSVKVSTVDAGFTGSIGNLEIKSDYDGTINQDSSLTIENGYSQGGGTMKSGAAITVNGPFSMSDGTLDLSGNSSGGIIKGDITVTGGTITKGTGTVVLGGDLYYMDSTGTANFGNVQIGQSPDTVNLSSDATFDDLTISTGDAFVTNGYDVTVNGNLLVFGALDATSNGTWETNISLAKNWTVSGTGEYVRDTSTVTLINPSETSIVNGSNIFHNLACQAGGKVVRFAAGSTQTVEAGGAFTIEGTASEHITLESTSAGEVWYIDPLGARTVSSVEVKDSYNLTLPKIDPADSVSLGNNTNWFLDYTITATCGANGTISPEGDVIAVKNSNKTFTIIPDSGYYIKNVLIDGVSTTEALLLPYEYTFFNITGVHTIEAYFLLDGIKVWDGEGATNDWTDGANWTGNTSPLSTDHIVFNSLSTKNSTVDMISTIKSITIESTYTGTIRQNSELNLSESFEQYGGKYVSDATQPFTVGGNFTIPIADAAFTRFTGTGSTLDPYKIYDVYGLQAMICYKTSTFELENNIDASATNNWNPSGTVNLGFVPVGLASTDSTKTFRGSFNGMGKTITGLYVSKEVNCVGMFGSVTGARISNVGLLGVNIRGMQRVGGLVGLAQVSTIVDRCYVTGSVTASISDSRVGGLVGANNASTISNCYAAASVHGTQTVGGLVGINTGAATIINSYATVDVSGKINVGGLAGWNNASTTAIRRCYATGNVSGESRLGGLVGLNDASALIINSYASGNVSSELTSGTSEVGGLAGLSQTSSAITNCYALGSAFGNGSALLGGLVGKTDGTSAISGSYYTGSPANSYGTQKTAADMKKKYTFSGWAFGDIWMIDEDKNIPYLAIEAWSLASGDWTSGVWIKNLITRGASYPQTADDNVYIGSGVTATVPVSVSTLGAIHMGTGSPRVTLGADLSVWTMAVNGGTFDAAGKKISVAGNYSHSAGTFTSGTGTVEIIAGASPSLIEGSTVFNNFSCLTPGKQLSFDALSVQTIEGTFTISGASGNRIGLRSSVPGSPWKINPTLRSVSYVDVKDSTNLAALPINPSYATNSGNNNNWFETFAITTEVTSGTGTIEPFGEVNVESGAGKTFIVSAEAGNYIADIKLDSVSVTTEALNTPYTVTVESVNASHTLSVYFLTDNAKVWDGGGNTNDWSEGANWTGNTVPQSTDHVTFDSTNSKDSTINSGFGGTVDSISILAGYSGTITQSNSLSVTGSFEQYDGYFICTTPQTYTMSVGGNFSITAGSGKFLRYTGGGTDPSSDPYGIYDVYGLQAMKDNLSSHFKLYSDIDASQTAHWNYWEPFSGYVGFLRIGDNSSGFAGTFNGNGHTISGLKIDYSTTTDYVGMFGYTDPGSSITDLRITGASVRGQNFVGALVGDQFGSISNCYVSAEVTGSGTFVGVLTGIQNADPSAKISNCYTGGSVSSSGDYTGGLAGASAYLIENSYSEASVNGANYVGGFAGANVNQIKNCYAKGPVTGSTMVGGFAGVNTDFGEGAIRGTIQNSYSTGAVTGGEGTTSGFVGFNTETVTNCYYDSTISGYDTGPGTPKTTAEMKQKGTFTGWDFGPVWTIDRGKSYPQLIWEIHNWTGDIDNDWTKAGNWKINLVSADSYPSGPEYKVYINTAEALSVPSGLTLGGLEIGPNNSNGLTLAGNLTLDNSGIREGTLMISGGDLNGGSYTMNVDGDFIRSGGTFTKGTSTVQFAGSGPSSIEGSTAFYNLKCETAGKRLSFEATSVQTVEGQFKITGASGNKIFIHSTTPGSQWYFNPSGTKSVSYADVKDSNNLNGSKIRARSSADGGNNYWWTFGGGGKNQVIIIQ